MNFTVFNILVIIACVLAILAMVKVMSFPLLAVAVLLICIALLTKQG